LRAAASAGTTVAAIKAETMTLTSQRSLYFVGTTTHPFPFTRV
jgi:hypothetical protein